MNELRQKTVSEFAQAAAAWIGIGGAVFAILTFCMQLGMWYGPMKQLPAQYEVILSKLNMVEGRINKTDWDMDSVKTRIDALSSQILVLSDDRSKLWDRIRDIDEEASGVKSRAVTREVFIEWAAALSARNRTISVPPLSSQRE